MFGILIFEVTIAEDINVFKQFPFLFDMYVSTFET